MVKIRTKGKKRKANDGASSSKKQKVVEPTQPDNLEDNDVLQPSPSSSSLSSSSSSAAPASEKKKNPKTPMPNLKKERQQLRKLKKIKEAMESGEQVQKEDKPKMAAKDLQEYQNYVANGDLEAATELDAYKTYMKELEKWKKDDGHKAKAEAISAYNRQARKVTSLQIALEKRKSLPRFLKAKEFLEDKLRIYNKYANATKDVDGNFWIRRAHLVYSQKPIVFVYADTMNKLYQQGNAKTKEIIKKSKIRSFVEGKKVVKDDEGNEKQIDACGQVRVFPDSMNTFHNPFLNDEDDTLEDFIRKEEEVEGGESDARPETDSEEEMAPKMPGFLRQSSHFDE